MRTAQTQSIAIAAPPEHVFAVVGDPTRVPEWAPAFATAIRPDGEHWIVTNEAGELPVRIRVSQELGTVDFLARERDSGAFSRVMANDDGSEYQFTVFLGPEQDADAQRRTVADELATVKRLAEGV